MFLKRILTIMLFTLSICAYSQSRHALVIGLGQYMDKSWGTIHGDKDVPLVKDMLTSCGYDDITTLINREATKAGILAAFDELYDRSNRGDIIYIHFSGHGQQITDLNGDEEDGFDEAWIPYDALYAYSDSYKGEKHLVDDEIGLWLDTLKQKIGSTGKILLVVDACHSGDSDRGFGDEDEYLRGAADDFIIPTVRTPARTTKAKENWMTLTACKNFQNNCEVRINNGEYYGILTYALYSNYLDFGNLENQNILNQLRQYVNLKRKRGRQTVTISGNHSLSQFFTRKSR